MPKRALTVKLHIAGADEVIRALNRLPKEANVAMRDAAGRIAQRLVPAVKAAAGSDTSPQSALLAATVKVARDRFPAIQAGGTRRLGSRRAPAWKLLFGSEFGSNRYTQFGKHHQGTTGSWFFPVVEAEQDTIAKEWSEAADQVIRAFGGGH